MAKNRTSEIWGGTQPGSNLTITSTAATGSGDYISFRVGAQTERLRIDGDSGAITLTGAVTTDGAQSFNSSVTVSANLNVLGALTIGGACHFNSSVTVSANLNVLGVLTAASLSGSAIATQSDQETSTSTTTAVSPGTQQFHPSAAKFWAKFNAAGAAQASYNVTSITDTATGIADVVIATDFSSANYSVVSDAYSAAPTVSALSSGSAQAAGSIRVVAFTSSTGAAVDPTNYMVAGFGDQ